MKLMVLIGVVCLASTLTHAAGRQEASEICKSMSFDSSRNTCISSLRDYDYFDQAAIKVCQGMGFDSNKNECVKVIGNKSYDAYETDNCNNQNFDSNKNECLKSSGRLAYVPPLPPPPGCISKQDFVYELQNLDRLVYEGKNSRARTVIYNLLSNVQRCR